uniref:Uncharacterized protein n=1 Tax=Clytia hemisphaerica TaxID=252671 RepID=A0A7M5WIE4_9CNID
MKLPKKAKALAIISFCFQKEIIFFNIQLFSFFKTRKTIIKEVVKDIQKQNNETIVTRVLGTRTSYATHDENRKLTSHETYQSCLDRTTKQKKRSVLNHAGNIANYVFDEKVFDKVKSFPPRTTINYKKLAEDYNLKHRITNKVPGHRGQIMEAILDQSDIDMSQFEKALNSGPRFRRAKRKILDTNIAVPSDESSEQIQNRMRSYIESGEYKAGEMIVPQQYERLIIKDGVVTTEVIEISGRKFVLDDIREKLLAKHSNYMRVKPDLYYDEMTMENLKFELEVRLKEKLDDTKDASYLKNLHRTRSFACWHDTSCVSNASHFLVLVHVLYDEALFYTDDEYAANSNGKDTPIITYIQIKFFIV